ncbi:aspartyl protease family protein, partial [Mycobacterium kansasii]
ARQTDAAGPSGTRARVYAITQQEAEASNTAVTGILPINTVDIHVLFDSGSTHSFVSPCVASEIGIDQRRLETPLIVSTPLGRSCVS